MHYTGSYMVDYTAFTEKRINRFNGRLPGLPKIANPLTALIIVSVVLVLLLSPIILNPIVAPVSIILVLGVVFIAYKLTWGGREASIRSALFAKRNGYSYSWQGGKFVAATGLGSVLGEPMMSNVVSGTIHGQEFTMCNTYGGKLFKVVMSVSLPNSYPHILLDSKQNDRIFSSLYQIFPKQKEIVLEGNFPDYFRLFTATNPVETLQIFSPELMARMIDYAHRADVEIIDKQLLLICNFKFQDQQIVRMMFDAVEQILKDIGVHSNNSQVEFDSELRIT